MPTRAPDDVAGAVDGELAVDGAADGEAAQVVVVHRPLQGIGALERGAGHQPRQAIRRAVSERHLPNQLAVDHLAHRCGAGVEQRRLGGHQDLVDTLAGSSVKSTCSRSPTRTSTDSRTTVRKPFSSTVTR